MRGEAQHQLQPSAFRTSLLGTKKVLRKMREKVLHIGSKVYEGRSSTSVAALRLHGVASGHEKIICEKCAKMCLMSEVMSMRGEGLNCQQPSVFRTSLLDTKKNFPKKCAKKRFMSEVISMEGEKMASRYNITLPNGVKFTLYYSQEQDKAELISK